MNEISIRGLQVTAVHGVLEKEKVVPQPFVFDVNLFLDLFAAGESDDLTQTVNYAEVCALIDKTARAESYNLIEKLAYECAFAVMEKFPLVAKAEITVSKPQAPIGLPFENVSVKVCMERQRVILSLGSSMGNSTELLLSAVDKLNEVRGVKVTKLSTIIETPPYGGVAKNKFLNCAVELECLLSPRALLTAIHKIEEEGGRTRTVRWEDRTLDIDIIFFGDKIISENGISIPHPDYANRPFVLIPVKEIAPDFVCPVTRKRMSDFDCKL